MVKQDDRKATLFACLSIHEGSSVHVNPLGNHINISISHRFISSHLVWFRQTHRAACRSVSVLLRLGMYSILRISFVSPGRGCENSPGPLVGSLTCNCDLALHYRAQVFCYRDP